MREKTYWPYIIVSYFSLMALGFLDNIRGPIFFDLTEDLRLGDTEASLFFVVTSLVLSTVSQFAFHLVGRISALTAHRIGFLIMGLGGMGVSYSTGLLSLVLSSTLLGGGMGLVAFFQNYSVSLASANSHRRQLLSGLHSFYALASLFAPLVASFGFENSYKWYEIVRGVSLLPFGLFLLSFIFQNPLEEKSIKKEPLDGGSRYWLYSYLYMGLMVGLYIAAELTISTRVTFYIRRVFELSADEAPFFQMLFFAFLLVGRLLFTFFPFSFLKNKQVLKLSLIFSSVFFVLGLSVWPYFISFVGFFMAPFFAVSVDYMVEVFAERSGKAISYCLGFGSYIIVVIHFLVGLLSQNYGIDKAMWAGPLCLFLSFLLLIFWPQFSYQLKERL